MMGLRTLFVVLFVLSGTLAMAEDVNAVAQSQNYDYSKPVKDWREGCFQGPPTGNADTIKVTLADDNRDGTPDRDCDGKDGGKGCYRDPIVDRAKLAWVTQHPAAGKPVCVSVEGRDGIGAVYYVTVVPRPGTEQRRDGVGGTDSELWADVQDVKVSGTLVLKDTNTGSWKSDGTDSPDDAPKLICALAGDLKGDVEFWLQATGRTYDWTLTKGSSTDRGVLDDTNGYRTPPRTDLQAGVYTLTITTAADARFLRTIKFVVPGCFAIAGHGASGGKDDGAEDGRAAATGFTWAAAATGDQLLAKLEEFCQDEMVIGRLYTFSHGYAKGMILENDKGFYHDTPIHAASATFADLQTKINDGTITFAPKSVIKLQACTLGGTFSSRLSQITGGTVYGAKSFSSPASDGWFWSDPPGWAKWTAGTEIPEPHTSDADLTAPNTMKSNKLKFWPNP